MAGWNLLLRRGTRKKIDPKHKFAPQVMGMIQEGGVIARAVPLDGIALCPPLIISEDEINMMFDRIESVMPAVDKLAASLGE